MGTPTALLRLQKQDSGENQNTWGSVRNADIERVEQAIAGSIDIDVTSGETRTLTTLSGQDDEARYQVLNITGTPAAEVILRVPALSKTYVIKNQCGQNLKINTQSSASSDNEVVLPTGNICSLLVDSDGVRLISPLVGITDATQGDVVLGDTTIGNMTATSITLGTWVLSVSSAGDLVISDGNTRRVVIKSDSGELRAGTLVSGDTL